MTPFFLLDLALRHLVGRFEADDAQIEFASLNTPPELALGLAGAEEQDRLGRTNPRNNLSTSEPIQTFCPPFAKCTVRGLRSCKLQWIHLPQRSPKGTPIRSNLLGYKRLEC